MAETDAQGWYHYDGGKTRILPVDTTSLQAWANSLIERARHLVKFDLDEKNHDGTPTTIRDVLFDTFGGAVPHQQPDHNQVLFLMADHPDYVQVMTEFFQKYQVEYCPVDPEEFRREIRSY